MNTRVLNFVNIYDVAIEKYTSTFGVGVLSVGEFTEYVKVEIHEYLNRFVAYDLIVVNPCRPVFNVNNQIGDTPLRLGVVPLASSILDIGKLNTLYDRIWKWVKSHISYPSYFEHKSLDYEDFVNILNEIKHTKFIDCEKYLEYFLYDNNRKYNKGDRYSGADISEVEEFLIEVGQL